MNKMETKDAEARTEVLQHTGPSVEFSSEQDLIDIKMLSFVTSMSARTIFRLMKGTDFPKIKVGKKLLFDKKVVMQYLVKMYGNW